MRVHNNSSFCSAGDLAIHIIFCVFSVLESIAGCIGSPILGWIIYSLWTYTYGHCYMSKYPTLARLGAIILPVPIVNIISISICSLIGKIKYGNKFFVEDGFDRKKEGLIFKIYTKLLFLNEPRFVKAGKYFDGYAVIRNYYVRNGFQEFAMQDRCIATVEDGMSIIEAAQILRRITGEDPQFAKAFVESLLQIPRTTFVNYCVFFRIARAYDGAELVIREIAQIFGLSEKEYTICCPFMRSAYPNAIRTFENIKVNHINHMKNIPTKISTTRMAKVMEIMNRTMMLKISIRSQALRNTIVF